MDVFLSVATQYYFSMLLIGFAMIWLFFANLHKTFSFTGNDILSSSNVDRTPKTFSLATIKKLCLSLAHGVEWFTISKHQTKNSPNDSNWEILNKPADSLKKRHQDQSENIDQFNQESEKEIEINIIIGCSQDDPPNGGNSNSDQQISKEEVKDLAVINAVRLLCTIWVVHCHLNVSQKTSAYAICLAQGSDCHDPESSVQAYRLAAESSWWSFLAGGFGAQVDILFAIAGFLAVDNHLTKKTDGKVFSLFKKWIQTSGKRLIQLWMMSLVQVCILYYFGELQHFASHLDTSSSLNITWHGNTIPVYGFLKLMRMALMFQTSASIAPGESIPPLMNSAWSSWVDFVAISFIHLVCALIEYWHANHSTKQESRLSSNNLEMYAMFKKVFLCIAVLSWILKVAIYASHTDPILSYLTLAKTNKEPLFANAESFRITVRDVYPETVLSNMNIPSTNNLREAILRYDYTSFHMRWTAFFIGGWAAAWFRSSKDEVYHSFNWKALLITIVTIILCCVIAVQYQTLQHTRINSKQLSVDLVFTTILRPFVAFLFMMFIVCSELPSDHPWHISIFTQLQCWFSPLNVFPWIETKIRLFIAFIFEKLPIPPAIPTIIQKRCFTFSSRMIAKYCAMIYAVHPKLISEITLRYLPINGSIFLNFGIESAFSQFIIWSIVVIGWSLFMSFCALIGVEIFEAFVINRVIIFIDQEIFSESNKVAH